MCRSEPLIVSEASLAPCTHSPPTNTTLLRPRCAGPAQRAGPAAPVLSLRLRAGHSASAGGGPWHERRGAACSGAERSGAAAGCGGAGVQASRYRRLHTALLRQSLCAVLLIQRCLQMQPTALQLARCCLPASDTSPTRTTLPPQNTPAGSTSHSPAGCCQCRAHGRETPPASPAPISSTAGSWSSSPVTFSKIQRWVQHDSSSRGVERSSGASPLLIILRIVSVLGDPLPVHVHALKHVRLIQCLSYCLLASLMQHTHVLFEFTTRLPALHVQQPPLQTAEYVAPNNTMQLAPNSSSSCKYEILHHSTAGKGAPPVLPPGQSPRLPHHPTNPK